MSCENILIIEDDESIREMLRLMLELEGYQVYVAENGASGLNMASQIQHLCLILLDLMMPLMDGWQFVEAVSKNPALSQIPVVVVTAFGEKSKTIKSHGVLKKPIDLNALYGVVHKYCG